jgi:pantoate--beta-alanine ligase
VGILGVPTVREADGLALSSRNSYLLPEERAQAPAVRRALGHAADRLRAGLGLAEAEQRAEQELQEAGLRPDYVSVRRAADLAQPEPTDTDLVVLAAAWLGRARLIDNLRVSRPA